jgi:hypothetical protein
MEKKYFAYCYKQGWIELENRAIKEPEKQDNETNHAYAISTLLFNGYHAIPDTHCGKGYDGVSCYRATIDLILRKTKYPYVVRYATAGHVEYIVCLDLPSAIELMSKLTPSFQASLLSEVVACMEGRLQFEALFTEKKHRQERATAKLQRTKSKRATHNPLHTTPR